MSEGSEGGRQPIRKPFARRLAAGLGVLLALAALAHSGVWLFVTGRLERGMVEFTEAAARDGWKVEHGAARRTGWPMVASVEAADVVATRGLGTTQLRWTAERVRLTIAPASLHTLLLQPDGRQSFAAGSAPPIEIAAASTVLRVPLDGAGPVVLAAREVVATRPGRLVMKARQLDVVANGVAGTGAASGVFLSPPLPPPFDGVGDVAFRALLSAPFPNASDPAQSAAAWQQTGGRVDVPEFSLHLGPLSAEGSGSGDLDAQLQPRFQATVRMRGAAEVLDAATAAGIVPPGPTSAIKAVLNMLALAAGGGPVTLPILLRDGTLTVARFPVLRMPTLDWSVP